MYKLVRVRWLFTTALIATAVVSSTGTATRANTSCDEPIDGAATRPASSVALPTTVELILDCVASGKAIPADADRFVPELVDLVEIGFQLDAELATRALGQIGKEAWPAAEALCQKLNDSSHAMRQWSVEALVAIGERSIGPLEHLSASAQGRTLAAAADALRRLKRISPSEARRLARNADPRVRVVAIRVLQEHGKPAVQPLLEMLQDGEAAVAVQAATAIAALREDADHAVPALIRALSRNDLAPHAIDALAAYGTDARRALPAIIVTRLNPNHFRDWYYSHPISAAMDHIGPPDRRDLPELVRLLKHEQIEVRELAAQCLARVPQDCRDLLGAMEEAFHWNLAQYRANIQAPQSVADGDPDESDEPFYCAMNQAELIWRATEDGPRFIRLILELESADEYSYRLCFRNESVICGADACAAVEMMLRHPSRMVRTTALNLVVAMKADATPLAGLITALVNDGNAEIASDALAALEAIGPAARNAVEPAMIAARQKGQISLKQFANTARAMRFESSEALETLESEAANPSSDLVYECALALADRSKNPRSLAEHVVRAARESRLNHYQAVEALARIQNASEISVPYLIELLSDEDVWIRKSAVTALGQFGAAASDAVEILRPLSRDDSEQSTLYGVNLATAVAIFRINGDETAMKQQLQRRIQSPAIGDRLDALESINDFGIETDVTKSLLRACVASLAYEKDDRIIQCRIDGLRILGTSEDLAEIERLAHSTNFAVQKMAEQALKEHHATHSQKAP